MLSKSQRRKNPCIEVIFFISTAFLLSAFTNKTSLDFLKSHINISKDTIPQNEILNLKRKDIYLVTLDTFQATVILRKGDSILFSRKDFDALPSQVRIEISANNDGVFKNENIPAKYPGDNMSWLRFINRTTRFPREALRKNIQGTVIVGFRVDESGNLSDIKAISGPEKGGLREETIRVLRESGTWEPATWNGYKVMSYRQQALSFKWQGGR